MLPVVIHDLGLYGVGRNQADDSQKRLDRPHDQGHFAGAKAQVSFRFGYDVKRAVRRQGHQSDHARHHGVPVQNAGMRADPEIGPQRLKEVPVRPERNSADHVAQRRAEEDSQESTRSAKKITSKKLCHTGFSMCARNSMPMPRSISSQSTIIKGR